MSFLPWDGLLRAPEPCLVRLGLPGWCCSDAVPVLDFTAINSRHKRRQDYQQPMRRQAPLVAPQ